MHREGENGYRIPAGCAISGIFDKTGKNINGWEVVKSIAVMHDRSNGLGGGFAGYGIYPQFKDHYAFHIFYDSLNAKHECEMFLEQHFDIADLSKIPTRKNRHITDEPMIWRYFVIPLRSKLVESQLCEEDFTRRCVLRINDSIKGANVFSSGKNMGCFKAIGFPEDVGDFFRLEEYEGYCWTAHGRYPTNTPGWWGGAHPFDILGMSVVHNGEISSYDANRNYMESAGYKCTLLTDTEVIAYMFDYLIRQKKLTLEEAANVVAAPFWQTIEAMPEKEREKNIYLRDVFSSLLINGPFSILLGYEGGLMALNDRLKLRSLVVGEKGKRTYIASEECAIRAICPDVEKIWAPKGGQPVILSLEQNL